MTSIRKREGFLAAHALLLDITLNPEPCSAERLAIALKLAEYPDVLATIVAKVFDQTGSFPHIFEDVTSLAGREAALAYGTALFEINRQRTQRGMLRFPIRFTAEVGRPHNVVYISDFAHLRRSAA